VAEERRARILAADTRSKPEAALALPTAEIAVMGPEAAVNAVYYNTIRSRKARSGRPS
jgi:acetyl-CoA carboxylase carboxyltransferase component